jgi:hypothetical protein
MGTEAGSLCEYVSNIIDEALHDLDPARVRARKRLHAMLARCANVTEYNSDGRSAKQAKPNSNPWLQFLASLEPVKPLPPE